MISTGLPFKAKNVQNGLVDELGCIVGGVASRVVAEAARQVLKRPDS